MFMGIASIGLIIFFLQKSVAKREKHKKRNKEENTLYGYLQQNYCGYYQEALNREYSVPL